MFGNDFKQRTKLENIADYLLTDGQFYGDKYEGSMEEQSRRFEKEFMQSLKSMKERVLAEQWEDLSEYQAQCKFEDFIDPVFRAERHIENLSFRAGLLAGIAISSQLEVI